MLDPTGEPIERIDELPQLADDELEQRIGARPATRTRVVRTRPERARYVGGTRRRVLWRDSATILIVVILTLLGARFLLPNGNPATSPSPDQSERSVVATATAEDTVALSAIPTIGIVVSSGLHLDATPTPPPLITLGPVTPKPSETLGPTPKPTVKASGTPAPVVAAISCTPGSGSFGSPVTVICQDTGTGATSWSWDFGDGGTATTSSASHDYVTNGTFTITLTVAGPGTAQKLVDSDCCWDVSIPAPS